MLLAVQVIPGRLFIWTPIAVLVEYSFIGRLKRTFRPVDVNVFSNLNHCGTLNYLQKETQTRDRFSSSKAHPLMLKNYFSEG